MFLKILKKQGISNKWILLLVFNPLFILFSREGGYYIFHLLCAQLIFRSYIYALEKGKTLPFIASMTIGFYSYYYQLFLIIVLFFHSIFLRKRRYLFKAFMIFMIFSIPLFLIIFFNPFIIGIMHGASQGLTATKPPIFAFPKERVAQYMIFFIPYLLFSQGRYLTIPLFLSIVFTLFILWRVFIIRNNGKEWGFLLFMISLMLCIFSLFTQERIYRFSFFPYHLFPFYFLLIIALAKAMRQWQSMERIFYFIVILIMLFQDYDLVFNEYGFYYNKDEVRRIISNIKDLGYSENRDIIFCNYSYEWKISSLNDTFKVVDPINKYHSMEEYYKYGSNLWKGKHRIFEIKPRYIKILRHEKKFEKDFYYQKIKLMNAAESDISKNYAMEKKMRLFGDSGSKFELIVWVKRDKGE